MSTKQQLSDEQERMRLEGLRILARIIARHYLAHPEKYAGSAVEEQEAPSANGRPASEGEPPHRDGTT